MKCKFVQEAHGKLGGKGEMVVYIAAYDSRIIE